MAAEGLSNTLYGDAILRPNAPEFDPIMTTAIGGVGNGTAFPLNEIQLKAFLSGYHFDRRTEPTTNEVKSYSDAVFKVYNQLIHLRKIADALKNADEHQSEDVMRRIAELLTDLYKLNRGKIPSRKNAAYCQLNIAIIAALTKTGLEGPLGFTDLWDLVTGTAALHVQKVMNQNAEAGQESTEQYFAQIVPAENPPQMVPEPSNNAIGYPVQLIIDQVKKLRSNIKTNKKNEKCAYDTIYERLKKAIDDLRKENDYS